MLFTKESTEIRNHLSKKVNDRGFKGLNELYRYLKKVKMLNYSLIKDYSETLIYNSIDGNKFISDNIVYASKSLLNKRKIEMNIGGIILIITITISNILKIN